MSPNQKGSAIVPLILVALWLLVAIAMVNSNRERRLQDASDAGSFLHAKQVQAVLDNYARRQDRYPTAAEFDRLMLMIKPLYPGLVNTHSGLPTEPRTAWSSDPGAINVSVSTDCCCDTIRVIGTNRTVIWTIIGLGGGKTVIFGGVSKKPRHGLNSFNPLPHG